MCGRAGQGKITFALVALVSGFLGNGSAPQAQSDELLEASRQGAALVEEGRYEEAVPYFRSALELSEHELAPDDLPDYLKPAYLVRELAALHEILDRPAQAEPMYERALAMYEKTQGRDGPDVIVALEGLARLYLSRGRFVEAVSRLERIVAAKERVLGSDHLDLATSLENLATSYWNLGRYSEAESLWKRSLSIVERGAGRDDAAVAVTLTSLGMLNRALGRYDDAGPFFERAVSILETAFGPDHPTTAVARDNLATLFLYQGRHNDAEAFHQRTLALAERELGPAHPLFVQRLNDIATVYVELGRYGDAVRYYKRALRIREESLGLTHPEVASSLNNLAALYSDQGRYGDAELLYKRALEIYESVPVPNDADVAFALSSLAAQYGRRGRDAAAEPLIQRALELTEKARGPNHPDLLTIMSQMASCYRRLGKYNEAEQLAERALAIYRAGGGSSPSLSAVTFLGFGDLFLTQGNYAAAEALFRLALHSQEKYLGPDHPDVAVTLTKLAGALGVQSRTRKALEFIRRASAIHRDRAVQKGRQRSVGGLSELKKVRAIFAAHVLYSWAMGEEQPSEVAAMAAEAFEAGQLARATSTGAAVAGMAARFGAGDNALAVLVRARQDAAEAWRRADKKLIEAGAQPADERDLRSETRLRNQLAELDRRLAEMEERLAGEFPEYSELVSPRSAQLTETQGLLESDEALLAYVESENHTFLWVVRRDRAALHRLDMGAEDLSWFVADLRAGLDPDPSQILTIPDDIPSFDTSLAHELYGKLFAPAEPLLDGVRHVFVVPDTALLSLPLGVLVTEKPAEPVEGFEAYRDVAWLSKRYAMSVLPSVSSLRALRRFAKGAQASRPFFGVGDPQLSGETRSGRGVESASLFTARGTANVELVRNLASLPDSAGELRSLAETLGADGEVLLLGTGATETAVKQARLDDYKVLAFATHGLIRGELKGLAEPALVLTPPNQGTAQDDGLLTASEVAQLELDADWVILSACNTAAADGTPEAEGLSGLAKAFFYAGSRSLLVSHWSVDSKAAVLLTTRMLSESSSDPGLRRAEALQRSILAFIEDKNAEAHYGHPMYWAPFVLVGEGGR